MESAVFVIPACPYKCDWTVSRLEAALQGNCVPGACLALGLAIQLGHGLSRTCGALASEGWYEITQLPEYSGSVHSGPTTASSRVDSPGVLPVSVSVAQGHGGHGSDGNSAAFGAGVYGGVCRLM